VQDIAEVPTPVVPEFLQQRRLERSARLGQTREHFRPAPSPGEQSSSASDQLVEAAGRPEGRSGVLIRLGEPDCVELFDAELAAQ
jgi:hypothetical protein